MNTPLWIPSDERKRAAHLTRFIDLVNARYGLADRTYRSLHAWSIIHIPEFWAMMWEFGEMRASRGYDAVVDDLGAFPGAKWFAGARLNFAENLLRYRDGQAALIFRDETGRSIRMTYAELYEAVARLAGSLRAVGVRTGPGLRLHAESHRDRCGHAGHDGRRRGLGVLRHRHRAAGRAGPPRPGRAEGALHRRRLRL